MSHHRHHALAPAISKAGLYYLPSHASATDLSYMLQQMAGHAVTAPPIANDVNNQLVVRRQPDLSREMMQRIHTFDGPVLLLSAACAHRLELAAVLSRFAADITDLQPHRQWRLETILQETISNAICHGSLEISPHGDQAALQARLNDPGHGGRLIAVGWHLTPAGLDCFIMDQGEGFDADAIHDNERQTYKGLNMIGTLTAAHHTDHGTCLNFKFPLNS